MKINNLRAKRRNLTETVKLWTLLTKSKSITYAKALAALQKL